MYSENRRAGKRRVLLRLLNSGRCWKMERRWMAMRLTSCVLGVTISMERV